MLRQRSCHPFDSSSSLLGDGGRPRSSGRSDNGQDAKSARSCNHGRDVATRPVSDASGERADFRHEVLTPTQNRIEAEAPDRTTAVIDMADAMRLKAWTGFRSVLCAIDFSEHSRIALRHAAAIAARAKGALTVCYANDPLLVAAVAAALHDRQVAKRSATELQRFVDETLTGRSNRELRVKSLVSMGRPPDEIMSAAARSQSDLLVLGTHGLTGPHRMLLGSTTLDILQRTTIPVLAVPRSERNATGVPPSWPGDRIVAAIDLSADSQRAVDTAAGVARWFGSSLLLLHVVSRLPVPAWLAGGCSAHDRIRVALAQQRIDALADAARRHVATGTRVICGDVSDEIAVLAATERTDLVMTTLRARHRWRGSQRGGVSYHVLAHAVTAVLACPPRWRPADP
jgi:nucleotide-binding universal stress UspA family protein